MNYRMPATSAVDVEKILTPEERASKDQLVVALNTGYCKRRSAANRKRRCAIFSASKKTLTDDDVRTAIRLVMATPQYQVSVKVTSGMKINREMKKTEQWQMVSESDRYWYFASPITRHASPQRL